jgi:hypothetical protein
MGHNIGGCTVAGNGEAVDLASVWGEERSRELLVGAPTQERSPVR